MALIFHFVRLRPIFAEQALVWPVDGVREQVDIASYWSCFEIS